MSEQAKPPASQVDKLTSEDVAALIVDALQWAGLLRKEDAPRAIAIATEEIEVRKIMGDL